MSLGTGMTLVMTIQSMRGRGKMKELRAKAQALEATCWIGKNGLTDSAVGEIKKMLKKRKLVKVKLLRSYCEGKDKKKIAAEIASRTGSTLVQQIGNVVVVWKR